MRRQNFCQITIEKQKAEEFIGERAERVIETMKLLGIDAGRMAEYSTDVLSEVFRLGDMDKK